MKIKILILALMLIFTNICNADFVGTSNIGPGSVITISPVWDQFTGVQLSPSHTYKLLYPNWYYSYDYTITVISASDFIMQTMGEPLWTWWSGSRAIFYVCNFPGTVPTSFPATIPYVLTAWVCVPIESVQNGAIDKPFSAQFISFSAGMLSCLCFVGGFIAMKTG